MRRPLTAVLGVALATGAAAPALGALSITPGEVRMLGTEAGGIPAPAFAARVGETYRLEVSYVVAGAPRIATGHRFVFENAVTGERMAVRAESFAPDRPGAYREFAPLRITAKWDPGVYRFLWTIDARNPRLPSVHARGSRVFLVVR